MNTQFVVRSVAHAGVALALILSLGACSTDETKTADGSKTDSETTTPPPFQLEFEELSHDSELVVVTSFAFVPDGSGDFFILSHPGELQHMEFDGKRAKVKYSIQIPNTYVDGSAGAVSILFDPNYEDNGYIYIARTLAETHSVLARFTVDFEHPEKMLASEVVILEVEEPHGRKWHNITATGFEEDGETLWATIGEKGRGGNAQRVYNLMGGLVRIEPSHDQDAGGYDLVNKTPVITLDAGAKARPELYAAGFRSPWRALYHKGNYIVGDVGNHKAEEINFVDRAGMNFGWPRAEGPCKDNCDRFDDPWISYPHDVPSHKFIKEDPDAVPTDRRAVYAGWIYQENDEDPYSGKLNDYLLFGDVYIGFVRAALVTDRKKPSFNVGHIVWPSGWAQGPDGYIYVWTMGTTPQTEAEAPGGFYRVRLAEDPAD